LPLVEAESGLAVEETDKIVATHLIDPGALRAADFDAFFAARRAALLALVSKAMGKSVSDVDAAGETPAAYVDVEPEPDDTVLDDPVPDETELGIAASDPAMSDAGGSDLDTGGQDGLGGTQASEKPSEAEASEPPQVDLAQLQRTFHNAMVDVYRRARTEAGYNATLFLTMVSQHGGLGAARTLLNASKPSDGFTALWERGRLDLSVEAVILEPRFERLFTDDERDRAKDRLAQYGYKL
jgi:hypothetical protein